MNYRYKKGSLLNINLLLTIIIPALFSCTQIYTMGDHLMIPLPIQQSFHPQQMIQHNNNNNESIPLKTITMKDFSSTTNNNITTSKKEAYIAIPLNDNANTLTHNSNNTMQHISEIETTTQEDYATPVRGGEMLFAVGGCAGIIGIIVYLSMLATGH